MRTNTRRQEDESESACVRENQRGTETVWERA
ncbi:hypothetical protein chiPu_0022645, partial [Chiloscyllium punctatum]|nr:hypothetical protein [Chiloscyllium punctatum]